MRIIIRSLVLSLGPVIVFLKYGGCIQLSFTAVPSLRCLGVSVDIINLLLTVHAGAHTAVSARRESNLQRS